MTMAGRCLLLSFLVCLAFGAAHARIETTWVKWDDRSQIPLTEGFGFAPNGVLNLEIKELKVNPGQGKKANLDKLGFMLSNAEAELAIEQEIAQDSCPLEDPNNRVLFRLNDKAIKELLAGQTPEYTVENNIEMGGFYYLYFVNCEPETPVSFWMRLEMYNLNEDGKRDYLSVGETELTTVLWTMFALFTSVVCFWGWLLWRNRDAAHKIHYGMLMLGVFKCLTVMAEALMYHYLESTGRPDGWNIAFYILTFFRGMLFFTVVVLIGTGWSYMKPYLGDQEKKILLIVVPLQVLANVAIIVTGEESRATRDWFTWRDVFHLVDIICCCAILFPIVWSIKHLREASQTDGKAARNLEKLTLFRQFYVTVVVFIYFTRIVVYLIKSTMNYEYAWLSTAADELATLAFYVWTGVKFRPHTENQYLRLDHDEGQQQREIEL